MSVIRTINTTATTEEDRTFRAVIETPRGGDYSVRVHRETIQLDADGKHIGSPTDAPVVIRMAADIVNESVKLPNGTVVPAKAILAALPLFFDRWAEEDAARRTAP